MFPQFGKILSNYFLVGCGTCGRGLYGHIRFSSSEMARHTDWRIEKNEMLHLPLTKRRLNYGTKEYLTLGQIPTWHVYADKENVKTKKFNQDDFQEFKKISVNHNMDEQLANKVSIFKGDITQLEVDAIVNAANSMLKAGGGVDGAIHRIAGPLLQEECNFIGGCQTGKAEIMGAYKLPARYVIATVGPQNGDANILEECYKNVLAYHEPNDIGSIAFPCISTGVYGFPHRLAAHIALRTVRQFLETHHMERIIFCTFMPIDTEIYETLMQLYFPVHQWNFED